MFTVFIIAYVILLIPTMILHISAVRNDNRKMRIGGYVTGAVAGLCALIAMLSINSSSSSGVYTYYVNGVKQSEGAVWGAQSLFVAFMFTVVSLGLFPLIGQAIGKRMQKNKELNRPSLALAIISIVVGYNMAMVGVAMLTNNYSVHPIVLVILFIIGAGLIGLGIRGIIRFKNYKRGINQNKEV